MSQIAEQQGQSEVMPLMRPLCTSVPSLVEDVVEFGKLSWPNSSVTVRQARPHVIDVATDVFYSRMVTGEIYSRTGHVLSNDG